MQIFERGNVKKMIFNGGFLKNRRLGGEKARPRDKEISKEKEIRGAQGTSRMEERAIKLPY